MRRSDVILLTELTERIKDEIGFDLPEAVDVVHVCLSAAQGESKFWTLPVTGGSPHVSGGDTHELIAHYVDSQWWRSQPGKLRMRGKVEAIDEMAMLRIDAEKFVRHVREHVGEPAQAISHGNEFMDRAHPRYAPKLAAAVQVWREVVDPGATSVKQALDRRLREIKDEFGLTNEAIKECSKVANWRPLGGAPKTPAA